MPLRMTLLERLLVQLNLLPTPLFDAMLAPGVEKAVLTACELGLFLITPGATMITARKT